MMPSRNFVKIRSSENTYIYIYIYYAHAQFQLNILGHDNCRPITINVEHKWRTIRLGRREGQARSILSPHQPRDTLSLSLIFLLRVLCIGKDRRIASHPLIKIGNRRVRIFERYNTRQGFSLSNFYYISDSLFFFFYLCAE